MPSQQLGYDAAVMILLPYIYCSLLRRQCCLSYTRRAAVSRLASSGAASSVRHVPLGRWLSLTLCTVIRSLPHEDRRCHDDTAYTDVRAQSLADSCAFPEYAEDSGWRIKCRCFGSETTRRGIEHSPIFVTIHYSWEDIMRVGGGADEEEDDQEEGLEVEEGGLRPLLALVTIQFSAV